MRIAQQHGLPPMDNVVPAFYRVPMIACAYSFGGAGSRYNGETSQPDEGAVS